MPRSISFRLPAAVAALLLAAAGPLTAQDPESGRSHLPAPDRADVPYGPDPFNTMDAWLAHTPAPSPVLVYFHGGGFVAGSKENLPPALLAAALRAGISVVAANYRLAPRAIFPANYLDCVRAVQFARHSAAAWHIDPNRVALTGSSAGGAVSLWIAFHDDLAQPKSADPVARESTRVSCAAVIVAQPTYDPRVIRKLVGPSAAKHPVFLNLYGLKPGEEDSEKAHRLYEAAAPITYLTPDDPPVFAYYGGSRALPPPNARAGDGIHHPNLGIFLKKRMDAVGVECVLRLKEDGGNATEAEVAFLRQHLGLAKERVEDNPMDVPPPVSAQRRTPRRGVPTLRLLFVPEQDSGSPLWEKVHAGTEKAVAALAAGGTAVSLDWQGPSKPGDLREQERIVDGAGPDRYDALLIASLDRQEMVQPVQQAVHRGLEVIAVEAPVDSREVAAVVGDTNFEAGRAAAAKLAALLGGRGNVILLRHHIDAADTEQREQGFLQAIQADWPNIHLLVTDFHAGPTPAIANRVVPMLIQRFRDRLDGIFASNELAQSEAASELRRLGLADKVKLVGVDLNGERIGEEAVRRAVDLLEGKSAPPPAFDPAEDPRSVVASGHGLLVVPSVGLVMAGIPPGKFLMGRGVAQGGFRDTDIAGRPVSIDRPFWLGKYELTQREWLALMPRNPSDFAGAEHPVDNVSWNDAMDYCRRLTRCEAAACRLPEGYGYQLPTEAQWEYACRAGTTEARAGDLDEMGWYVGNSGSWSNAGGPVSRSPATIWQMGTHPVGQKEPNGWGLYDMYGNVVEWCQDRDGNYAIARGGGWWTDPEVCTSFSRTRAPVTRHHDALGFRVALSPLH